MALGSWRISGDLKVKVTNALQRIGKFKAAVTDETRWPGVDAVVCGHTHKAATRKRNSIFDVNDRDRLKSCAANLELADDRIEIVEWAKRRSWSNIDEVDQTVLPEPAAA